MDETGDEAAVPIESATVAGSAGVALDLPIAQGAATGYAWSIDLPAGLDRLPDGPTRRADPGHRLGGDRGGVLRVSGPAGRYRVMARLARPWEADRPIRIVAIDVHLA